MNKLKKFLIANDFFIISSLILIVTGLLVIGIIFAVDSSGKWTELNVQDDIRECVEAGKKPGFIGNSITGSYFVCTEYET